MALLHLAYERILSAVHNEDTVPLREAELPGRQRVVAIRAWDVSRFQPESRLLHDFAVWRQQVRTVENLGAAVSFERNLATEDGRVEPVRGAEVTANAFELMGTGPLLGRTLRTQDERPTEPPVVVISHALWQRLFGGDRGVLGRALTLNGRAHTIIGVMPDGLSGVSSSRSVRGPRATW